MVYTLYQCTQLPGTTLHIRRDVIQATVTSHPHLCQSCNENLIYIFSICIEALEIVSSNDQTRTYTEPSWIIQPFYMCILKERHPSVAYTCQYQLNSGPQREFLGPGGPKFFGPFFLYATGQNSIIPSVNFVIKILFYLVYAEKKFISQKTSKICLFLENNV